MSEQATSRPAPGPARTVRIDGLEVAWGEGVLEPRPWTSMQARWGAEILGDRGDDVFAELGCGAGHIGLLTAALTGCRLVAVDRDPLACACTTENAERAGLSRVDVRLGELEHALGVDERFGLLLADPPWVPSASVGSFPDDPPGAIDGGADGLDVARRVVVAAAGHLLPGGTLLIQLGTADQARQLCEEVDPGWAAGELRVHERGVVQRLDRSPDR